MANDVFSYINITTPYINDNVYHLAIYALYKYLIKTHVTPLDHLKCVCVGAIAMALDFYDISYDQKMLFHNFNVLTDIVALIDSIASACDYKLNITSHHNNLHAAHTLASKLLLLTIPIIELYCAQNLSELCIQAAVDARQNDHIIKMISQYYSLDRIYNFIPQEQWSSFVDVQ